jgi:hypothetical protein
LQVTPNTVRPGYNKVLGTGIPFHYIETLLYEIFVIERTFCSIEVSSLYEMHHRGLKSASRCKQILVKSEFIVTMFDCILYEYIYHFEYTAVTEI